ncbi:hypothetical protein [Hyalangium versicolor]|uniref:hypothetical protein n=1 Tax=Hyalangium versicolor TaxID=2861190 RepID=UPI001CCAAEE3|nr:hypothetical protein [Hyalangium versicolor]
MIRIWLCIIALLCASVGDSVSMPTAAVGSGCTQNCADDDERGQCAPDCTDCLCCVHAHPVMLAAPTALLLSVHATALIEHEQQKPPSVDLDDILHVPRALFA